MARKGKPGLGLELSVLHPASTEWPAGQAPGFQVDADGHYVFYEMVSMRGAARLWLTVRRGLAPSAAAALLRKLADRLDRHGDKLLNLPEGGEGWFSAEGEPVEDPPPPARDADGNPILPPAE